MSALCASVFCAMLFANAAALRADETEPSERVPEEAPAVSGEEAARPVPVPRLHVNGLSLHINAQIMDRDRVVSWAESHRKTTIPGQPVEIKLLGANVVVAVRFTPYMCRMGARNFLVAQGQVWIENPGVGIRYHASMQTLPVQFGEPVYFFPLGPGRAGSPSIKVVLTVYPHDDDDGEN